MIQAVLKPINYTQRMLIKIKEQSPSRILLYMIIAFIVGRGNLFGYMFPFAVAYFSVLANTKKMYLLFAIPIAAGIFSCKVPEYVLVKYIIIMGVILCASLLLSEKVSQKPISLAVYTTLLFMGTAVLYQLFTEVFLLYDIFIILTESISIFTFTYLFFRLPDLVQKNAWEETTIEEIVCVVCIIVILVSVFGDMTVFNLRIRYIMALLVIFIAAFKWGISIGSVVGFSVGTVIAMTSIEALESIALFGMAGIIAGFFKNSNRFLSSLIWVLCILIFLFYFSGLSEGAMFFLESCVAALFFNLVPEKMLIRISSKFSNSVYDYGSINQLYGDKVRKMVINNLKNYSETFESLANTYSKAYEKSQAVGDDDKEEIISKIKSKVCDTCDFNKICWKSDHARTDHVMKEIIFRSDKGLRIERDYINKKLGFSCANLDQIIQYTQNIVQAVNISYKWQRKLEGSREITASQFRGIAKSINHLIKEINQEQIFNLESEKRILMKMRGNGLNVSQVNIIEGDKSKNIVMEINSCDESDYKKIEKLVSEELGEAYSISKYDLYSRLNDNKSTITLKRTPKYEIITGASKYAKEMNVCGDSFTCMEFKNNEYLIALSDGMGSGEKAARESMLTIHTLQHLLEAGFDKELALKTMNSMLLLKSQEEIFSTVDIAIINLDTGDASFYKIGAAAAFIKRKDGTIEVIKYSTLPIGIIDKIKIEEIEVNMTEGDMIIMVSDGILDACNEEEKLGWMQKVIGDITSKDPQTMSDLILNKAVSMYGNKEKDDMTVITAKLN